MGRDVLGGGKEKVQLAASNRMDCATEEWLVMPRARKQKVSTLISSGGAELLVLGSRRVGLPDKMS